MKLSNDTLAILRNFSAINHNLVVNEGNTLSTISEKRNIMASASVTETFDTQFGIYDLNEFLSAVSLVEDPSLEFTEETIRMTGSNGSNVLYRTSVPSVLSHPQKSVNMPSTELTITLNKEMIDRLRKAGSVLGHDVVSFRGDNGKITACVINVSNPSSNTYEVVIDENNDCTDTFDFQFLIENFKLLPGDYEINISSKLISHWKSLSNPVEYWIALEKNSTYS